MVLCADARTRPCNDSSTATGWEAEGARGQGQVTAAVPGAVPGCFLLHKQTNELQPLCIPRLHRDVAPPPPPLISGMLHALRTAGIIPMSFRDQVAAQRLAMCNDIGEASYVDSLVAAALLRTLARLPDGERIMARVEERYKIPLEGE